MKLTDCRYEELKQEIADLLETYDIKSYPIDLEVLASRMKVPLISYDTLVGTAPESSVCKSEDSFIVIIKNRPYILYNRDKCDTRMRFSIAHEIAHIWLEHVEDSDENEAEANFFASNLLAPVPLILKYGLNNSLAVSFMFNVSLDAGDYAFKRAIKRNLFGLEKTRYEYAILDMCSLKGGDRIAERNKVT